MGPRAGERGARRGRGEGEQAMVFEIVGPFSAFSFLLPARGVRLRTVYTTVSLFSSRSTRFLASPPFTASSPPTPYLFSPHGCVPKERGTIDWREHPSIGMCILFFTCFYLFSAFFFGFIFDFRISSASDSSLLLASRLWIIVFGGFKTVSHDFL